MEYHKYTEGGWQLEELREENVEKWNYHPTSGVNEEIIRKTFKEQTIPLNDELADLSDANPSDVLVDIENELIDKIYENEDIEKQSLIVVSQGFDDFEGFNILKPEENMITEIVINEQETSADHKKDKVNVSLRIDYEMVEWNVVADIAFVFADTAWKIDEINVSDYNMQYKEGYECTMTEEDYKRAIAETDFVIGEQTLQVETEALTDMKEVWVISEETGRTVSRYFTYRISGDYSDYYGIASLLYMYSSDEGWILNKSFNIVSAQNIDITGQWKGYMTVNNKYPELLIDIESCDENGVISGTVTFSPSETSPDIITGVQAFTGTIDSEFDVYISCEKWVEKGIYSKYYNALLAFVGDLDVNEGKLVGGGQYDTWEAICEQ